MKSLNILGMATLGLLALTACEGGDLFEVNSPDWIAQRADSIKNNKPQPEEVELEGMMEDVYTIGKTDFSSGWWAEFSKDYVIPDGEVWNAVFNLNINPAATNTYKNFALIVTNDVHRGEGGYTEYGACRFDHQPSGNSEWGDVFFQQHRDDVTSTLTFGSDTDAGVDKLGGKVTLTIDRSNPNAFIINITNGTVTKTMNIKEPLPYLNEDPANGNIRAFLVVEGSYIDFQETNIEPIGGCTSREDKQPLSMELKGVPGKVLPGQDIEELMANVTGLVQFEQGVSKEIPVGELTLQVIPDLETIGSKTLVAAYGKTFKGAAADKPVVGYATFEVTDKLFTYVGDGSNTTPFWGAHTANVKVAAGETYISTFTNYTCGAANWNNFCVVLCAEGGQPEYAVVRADNFGWGMGYEGNANLVNTTTVDDWGTWLAAMDGAKVTTYVTNCGDGTANIVAEMLGTNGVLYTQRYEGINQIDPENFYFNFTVDNCHLEFDNVIGDENNTTGFWGAHSADWKVPAGATYTTTFTNFTCGASNWNNFCVVLCAEGGQPEYAVVRADNYGWGMGYEGNEGLVTSGGQQDWGAWLAAMDGAKVKLSVTNCGDGTANVRVEMLGTDGVLYEQFYNGINNIDPENLYFNLTVDNSHILFDTDLQ